MDSLSCPRCHTQVPGDSRFCPECGGRLRASVRISQWRERPWVALLTLVLVVFLFLMPGVLYVWAGLPTTQDLDTARLPLSTKIYDRTGTVLLGEIQQGSDRRRIVTLSSIAPVMQQATISVEDRAFYSHHGLNLGSMIRAAFGDLFHLRLQQGGSTITQQLAKNIYLSDDRSLLRKFNEVVLALEIERQYSKRQILEAYLNRIYYGNQAYGVEAAAETYFGTSASRLTLPQAALLAGLPQAPSDLDPYTNLKGARQREGVVLDAMVRTHAITRAQATAAMAQKLGLADPSRWDVKAPHFVRWIAAQLEKSFGKQVLQEGGLTVVTSLDWHLQMLAENAVRAQVASLQGHNVTDGGLVAVDPKTGEVLAMVGSAGPGTPGGEYNMALIPRQPGSSFKLFTYTAAIESGKYTMASWIEDEPIAVRLGDGSLYQPRNYDGYYHGWLPIPFALGNSLNIPAVKVELGTGIPQVVDVARRMGVTTFTQPAAYYQPSLTLGGYEVPLIDMAAGASTLAARGTYRRPEGVLKILNHHGDKLFSYDPQASGRQAVSPQVAFIMSQMLSDDRLRALEFGRGSDLVIPGHTVAAKTGTSNDFTDNLTLGYTPDLAVAVWTGNADHSPMRNVSGIVGAAPIFHAFMSAALAGVPDDWYTVPPGLVTREVAGITAYLLAGTESVADASQPPAPLPGAGRHHKHG